MPSPLQTPHSSSSAEPPQSPAQSSTLPSQSQKPSPMPSPLQTPHSSSSAEPPQTPSQSISAIQSPLQSKFSSGYSQVPSSTLASALKLQALSSVHPKTSSGAVEFSKPGVPPGISKLACQFSAIELSKSGAISSRVDPSASAP